MGLLLLSVQCAHINGFVLGVQAFIGTQAGVKLCDDGQGGVVGGAQLRRVGHGVQVANSAPGAAQLFSRHIQHGGDAGPTRGEVAGCHFVQRGLGINHERVYSRADVFWLDAVKQWDVRKV